MKTIKQLITEASRVTRDIISKKFHIKLHSNQSTSNTLSMSFRY